MSTPRSGRATLTAFRAAAHIPRAIWQPCAQLASLALAARPPKPLRQWAINARVVTGAQPHMVNALSALQTAKSELQAAQANKGGHRLKAIDLVNQAIGEVQAGMAAAGG